MKYIGRASATRAACTLDEKVKVLLQAPVLIYGVRNTLGFDPGEANP